MVGCSPFMRQCRIASPGRPRTVYYPSTGRGPGRAGVVHINHIPHTPQCGLRPDPREETTCVEGPGTGVGDVGDGLTPSVYTLFRTVCYTALLTPEEGDLDPGHIGPRLSSTTRTPLPRYQVRIPLVVSEYRQPR